MLEPAVLMDRSTRWLALGRAATALAACPMIACAQSATLSVTHDDPDGIVEPEQSVRITATIAWQAPGPFHALYSIRGDVLASPNRGTASNNLFPYATSPTANTIIDAGVPVGGAVNGVHLQYGDLWWVLFGQPPESPWGFSSGLVVVQFDWTAPDDPGEVTFSWLPSPAQPQTLITAPLFGSPPVRAVSTTYVGTSLTVIPTPATLAVLAVAAASRRRR